MRFATAAAWIGCLLVALTPGPAAAQDPSAGAAQTAARVLPLPEIEADPAIPTCLQVLGYDWGAEVSSHAQVEAYVKALAQAAPERTRLVTYGHSYEGRSLNYLVISSAANIANLETIRQNIQQLADPRPDLAAGQLIADTPPIVWLAYSVHGNEITPTDAALLTAYHLIADQRESTRQALGKLVVIIDPLQNPDGRERFVNVFRETRGAFVQADPAANEHTERWPGGRSNHYWFDMNRDWFRQSQKETQHKVAAYLHWHPQIYVDAHEMGSDSTYYFPPPMQPFNPLLLQHQHEWFYRIGRHQASWFDRYGFGYTTREMFDAFYPGYGSEWPTLQGGIGVLWEQASPRGMLIDRQDQTQLSYLDGVRHHYVSGLATVEVAASHDKLLLNDFYESRSRAIRLGEEGPSRHFFLLTGQRPQRAATLARLLRDNGIRVYLTDTAVDVLCSDAKNGEKLQRTVPAGSFHIPVAQPAGRLIRSLLDRSVEMEPEYVQRQLERNRSRLPHEIYDVTAWSLPLAFDVGCLETEQEVDVSGSRWEANQLGGRVEGSPARVAYLVPPTDGAMRAMAHWLNMGLRVHVADRELKLNGRRFERGTLILKTSGNPEAIHAIVQAASEELGIDVFGSDTAFVEEGAHLGGPYVTWVKPPKVALVVERPATYACGHTWHLLDQVLKYPVTRVNGRDFAELDLRPYSVLVLPDGQYTGSSGFDPPQAQAISDWVRHGGTLVTFGGATQWACSADVGLLANEIVQRPIDAELEPESEEKNKQGEREKVPPDPVPGAFFRAEVFQQHWGTFGIDPTLDVFYTGNVILSPTKETGGRTLVGFQKENVLTSGFCWPQSQNLLAGTPYLVYRSLGDGHLLAFTDDPNFRAMYPALQRLFINAAFFGPGH